MSSKLRRSIKRSFSYGDADYDEDTLSPGQVPKRRSSIFASAWSILTRQNKKKKLSVSSLTSETEELEVDDSESDTASFGNQKHEDAWLQACYNAVALLFFFVTGCVCLAVYYILEPFLHPLLWAVLVGMVFHPFKHGSTSQIKQWLTSLDSSGVPLSVGVVVSPFAFFNWMTQYFEYLFISSWKTIVALVIFVLLLFFAYVCHLPVHLHSAVQLISNLFVHIDYIMSQTVVLQVISLAAGFVVLVTLATKQSEHFKAMRVLSLCLWFLALLNVGVYLFGGVAVPAVIAVFGLTSLWPVIKGLSRTRKSGKSQDVSKSILKQGLILQATESLGILGISKAGCDEESLSGPQTESEEDIVLPAVTIISSDSSPVPKSHSYEEEKAERQVKVSFGPTQTLTPTKLKRRLVLADSKSHDTDEIDGKFIHTRSTTVNARTQSDQVFLLLFVACLMVTFWKYPFLLLCLVPFAFWCVLKRAIISTVDEESFFRQTWPGIKKWVKQKQWILFPSPMPAILTSFLYLDKKVLNITKSMIGSIVSACIIIFMMLLLVAGLIFFFFEIQVELTHYVTVGITVWNGSVASHLQGSGLVEAIEGNDSLQNTLEAFANQSYVYGREWIANQVHSLVSDSSDNTSAIEARILDLFDQLYQSYILKNTTVNVDPSMPTVENEDSDMRDKMFVEIGSLVSNNLETILSVLKSVWSIISENMTVALSSFSALVQLLFTGSSALFNLVIFLSALFYLLSYSETDYLPVKWVRDLLPNLIAPSSSEGSEGEDQSDKEQEEAFSKAIRSVFHASLRRAFFSGLYTWLIHTLFGMPVSILPSVLAGIAGAIPFVGSYWVTLPAVLELWLIEGHTLTALLLFMLSLLPVFYVDTIINREIEGGHPLLTGLAIAGGIYFAGLEGALIGPILLSCLLFFVDFYGDVFNTSI